MRRKIYIPAIALLLASPIAINLFGWNLYWYTDFGEKDLILASSVGVAHFAWAESIGDPKTKEEKDLDIDYLYIPDTLKTLIEVGPVHVFAEQRLDPMRFLGFGITNDDSPFYYKAFEFPWIVFPLLTLIGLKKRKREPVSGHNSDSRSATISA